MATFLNLIVDNAQVLLGAIINSFQDGLFALSSAFVA